MLVACGGSAEPGVIGEGKEGLRTSRYEFPDIRGEDRFIADEGADAVLAEF